MLIQKFNYIFCDRVDSPAGRKYKTPDGKLLPSVTTILDFVTDKSFLTDWREREGEENAAKITESSSYTGTHLHQNLENFLNGSSEINGNPMAKMMFGLIKQNGLKHLSEAWGTEVPLYYPELYAGTTDLVGVYKDRESIIDFKNARNVRKKEWIENYFKQLVAYAEAHNIMYGTNITTGVILMATQTGMFQEFIIEADEYSEYKNMWFDDVMRYYTEVVLA
ncbi:hypothetical protein RVBP17_1500 [Pseudomonas phage sp. 30-3]|nr:hypothetical protein RVBP17_1500 [Pseudomonas phage sp. 30-3]